MASIVKVKVGNHIYLYESTSYRNKEGKPRNRRICVGKVDKSTGLHTYKKEYIERKKQEGIEIKSAEVEPIFSVEDIKRSSVLQTGLTHLLDKTSKNIGLFSILKESFPDLHKQIFSVASYLVASGDPVSYCMDWMEKSDFKSDELLSSQKISNLFNLISDKKIEDFYNSWSNYISEKEYLALDITSISSWSKLIDNVEWGYNRDNDKLAQINLSLLLGLESRLPVRMTLYNGSINDVSTLETTIKQLAPELLSQIKVVMDKGFSSKKNIDLLLKNGLKFVIALSFRLEFTKKSVEIAKKNINKIENTITIGKTTIQGTTITRSWITGKKVFVHLYYNELKATIEKGILYGKINELIKKAKLDPNTKNKKLKKEFEHYLIIRKSTKKDNGYVIKIKKDVVEKELNNIGWLVIISNDISDTKEAIKIYRDKDVVEKGFMRTKNSLGFKRMRVHSEKVMEGKMFVGFIALILNSHIHNIMLKNNLYKKMTMKDLIKNMEKIKTQIIKDRRILFPLTKKQKDIFKFFKIEKPM